RTLEGLDLLGEQDVEGALLDTHPAVREHAIQLAGLFLPGGEIISAMRDPKEDRQFIEGLFKTHLSRTFRVMEQIIQLAEDPSPRVRLQCALFLGMISANQAHNTNIPSYSDAALNRAVQLPDEIVPALTRIAAQDLDEK